MVYSTFPLHYGDERTNISISSGDAEVDEENIIQANGAVFTFDDLTNRFANDSALWKSAIDFSMFITQQKVKVKIHFHHQERSINDSEQAICAYWDDTKYIWKTDGCTISQTESNATSTVCNCDHLTSFGILFGGKPREDSKNYVIGNQISQVLGGISIACLIFAQIVIHLGR